MLYDLRAYPQCIQMKIFIWIYHLMKPSCYFLITESGIFDIDKNFHKVGDYHGII
jgi:hypothetical protein